MEKIYGRLLVIYTGNFVWIWTSTNITFTCFLRKGNKSAIVTTLAISVLSWRKLMLKSLMAVCYCTTSSGPYQEQWIHSVKTTRSYLWDHMPYMWCFINIQRLIKSINLTKDNGELTVQYYPILSSQWEQHNLNDAILTKYSNKRKIIKHICNSLIAWIWNRCINHQVCETVFSNLKLIIETALGHT